LVQHENPHLYTWIAARDGQVDAASRVTRRCVLASGTKSAARHSRAGHGGGCSKRGQGAVDVRHENHVKDTSMVVGWRPDQPLVEVQQHAHDYLAHSVVPWARVASPPENSNPIGRQRTPATDRQTDRHTLTTSFAHFTAPTVATRKEPTTHRLNFRRRINVAQFQLATAACRCSAS
jgi:hypothetical protein